MIRMVEEGFAVMGVSIDGIKQHGVPVTLKAQALAFKKHVSFVLDAEGAAVLAQSRMHT
jgi:hypothetical protein